MADSFSWDLEGILGTGVSLGTQYMELKTAKEVKDSNQAILSAEQLSRDQLYNAQANIPANVALPASQNLVNSWNNIPVNMKLLAGIGISILAYTMLVK